MFTELGHETEPGRDRIELVYEVINKRENEEPRWFLVKTACSWTTQTILKMSAHESDVRQR